MADAKTSWTPLTVRNWYGEQRRPIEITSATAVWYHSGKPPLPIRWVLIRDPKARFKTRALLCTDLKAAPEQIVVWFVRRGQVEVTFQEVRTHLGVETQRQWSDLAIARTTPALLGLLSMVTLLAHRSAIHGTLPIRQAAWYAKTLPTFSDALAAVRQQLWRTPDFRTSLADTDMVKIPRLLLKRFTEALCYAA